MSESTKTCLQSMIHFSSVSLILQNYLSTPEQISDSDNRKFCESKIATLFPKEFREDLSIDCQGMVLWSVGNSNVVLSVILP